MQPPRPALAYPASTASAVQKKDDTMQKTLWKVLAALVTTAVLSGCAPLLIGGAGAVVADEVIEQDQGGDGLF